MEKIILKNKPLVEAIFELRWQLKEIQPGVKVDPNYKMLVGRVYERLKEEYPYSEQLPTATMPDEIAGYIVQYRFRKDKDRWPLVQIGPGIITLNDTEGYDWDDFVKRISEIITVLFELYPDAENSLKANSLLLRYIDAIEFDYEHEDIFSFPSAKPEGAIHMRVLRGKVKTSDTLLLETMVNLTGEDVPQEKGKIFDWVRYAHGLIHKWFFKNLFKSNCYRQLDYA